MSIQSRGHRCVPEMLRFSAESAFITKQKLILSQFTFKTAKCHVTSIFGQGHHNQYKHVMSTADVTHTITEPGFQARSRGGKWSWTLMLAQKRSRAGRWSWAAKVGLLSLQAVPQQQCNGHCPCDSAQHGS